MKYYSDVLNEMFDSAEELEKAEADDKAKAVEQDEAKAKIDDLFGDLEMAKERAKDLRDEANAMVSEARNKLDEALDKYCRKFGKYTGVTENGDQFTILCSKDSYNSENYYDKLKAAEKEFNEVIGDLLDIFKL